MAYDTATGTVVLFGGFNLTGRAVWAVAPVIPEGGLWRCMDRPARLPLPDQPLPRVKRCALGRARQSVVVLTG
jgi:hypothetical protein